MTKKYSTVRSDLTTTKRHASKRMRRSAFHKIKAGLEEALAVARGEKQPARVTTFRA
jgi:hypothetical protein